MSLRPAYSPFLWIGHRSDPVVAVKVNSGTSNAEGSWTEVLTASDVAKDVWELVLHLNGVNVSGAITDYLLDIGVDPSGGASYSAILSNYVLSANYTATNTTGAGKLYRRLDVPCAIPAGSSVAVRVQGSNGTTRAIQVLPVMLGRPARPHLLRHAQFSETVGTVTGTTGVSFTPGNASWGAWTLLGTSSRRCWRWQVSYGITNATMAIDATAVQLAHGDGSSYHLIAEVHGAQRTSEQTVMYHGAKGGFRDVPAGANLYVRGYNSGAPVSGYHALAHGFGG